MTKNLPNHSCGCQVAGKGQGKRAGFQTEG